jgi:hypothetical protein
MLSKFKNILSKALKQNQMNLKSVKNATFTAKN